MNPPVLETIDLHMNYQLNTGFIGQLVGRSGKSVRAVDGVSLKVSEGETLAIVGESGSGKTTLGRLVTLQEQPTSGTIWFQGKATAGLSQQALKNYRRSVQMIFQNPYEALDPRFTIGDSVAEPLSLHHVGTRHEQRGKAAAALAAVELRPADVFAERFPSDLSGGQLQRVAIARALVLEPRLLVADEPVSMLDVSVRSGIMNLMLELQERLGVSYLYITHDLAVARYMAKRTAVMYLGAVIEEGLTEELLVSAGHPYTRLLIAAVPDHRLKTRRARVRVVGEAASDLGSTIGCRFSPRCPLAQELCRQVEPPKVQLGEGRWAACHFAANVANGG
jgi:oligopeptide/dipeptide ABC transporter ATP-binding protein